MHEHGPNALEGPIRGSSAWWRGLSRPEEPAKPPPQATRKKTKKQEADKDKGIRKELVARVRREIEAGTYDTPEKWDAALDRLLERLESD